uniref:FRIGIDA-like protein n=1 Tax=Strongyloides venezuelensis TaxID=75913 RepID=A0A0K0FEU0_STRVS
MGPCFFERRDINFPISVVSMFVVGLVIREVNDLVSWRQEEFIDLFIDFISIFKGDWTYEQIVRVATEWASDLCKVANHPERLNKRIKKTLQELEKQTKTVLSEFSSKVKRKMSTSSIKLLEYDLKERKNISV